MAAQHRRILVVDDEEAIVEGLARLLRQDGYEPVRARPDYVPILMLTARGELVDKLVGLEIGADAYLAKPFQPRELLAQIRAILRLAVDLDPVARVKRGQQRQQDQHGQQVDPGQQGARPQRDHAGEEAERREQPEVSAPGADAARAREQQQRPDQR